jgi:membrane protease YdiL (CAAX protease family)
MINIFQRIPLYNDVDPENSINTYVQYLYLEHPLAWGIFFIAILPPIFEELAFRGYLFNLLKRVTNARNTIIATSFLFALVHFSFISIIWIFPFGLLLGYLRNKYNTLWLGMIIHFIHNLIVFLLDYFVFNYTIVGT